MLEVRGIQEESIGYCSLLPLGARPREGSIQTLCRSLLYVLYSKRVLCMVPNGVENPPIRTKIRTGATPFSARENQAVASLEWSR
jgi:hypothetical protein